MKRDKRFFNRILAQLAHTAILMATTTTFGFLSACRTSRIFSFLSIGMVIANIIGGCSCVFDVLNVGFDVLISGFGNAKCESQCKLIGDDYPLNIYDIIDTIPDISQTVFVFAILGLLMTERDAGYGSTAALLSTTAAIAVGVESTCELESGSLSSRTIILSRATTTGIAESCLRLDGKLFSRFIFQVYFHQVESDCNVNNTVQVNLKQPFLWLLNEKD